MFTSLSQSVLKVTHSRITVCIRVPPIIPLHRPCIQCHPLCYILSNNAQIDKGKVKIRSHARRPYRCAKVEVESEEAAKGDANDVVAADVDVGDERLPSAAHGHPCL